MTLQALAERAERETNPEMQAAILEEAWDALAEHSPSFRRFACSSDDNFDTKAGRFAAALDARSYESAAIMLVPEGWEWAVRGSGHAHVHHPVRRSLKPDDGFDHEGFAATSALALVASALRAHASQMKDER